MLAGGGLAGIAWETGILCGIADEAPEVAQALLAADVLLGTSAGSTVAAQLGSGTSLDELFARQVAEQSHEIDSGIDVDEIAELFVTAMTTPGSTKEQKLQRMATPACLWRKYSQPGATFTTAMSPCRLMPARTCG